MIHVYPNRRIVHAIQDFPGALWCSSLSISVHGKSAGALSETYTFQLKPLSCVLQHIKYRTSWFSNTVFNFGGKRNTCEFMACTSITLTLISFWQFQICWKSWWTFFGFFCFHIWSFQVYFLCMTSGLVTKWILSKLRMVRPIRWLDFTFPFYSWLATLTTSCTCKNEKQTISLLTNKHCQS